MTQEELVSEIELSRKTLVRTEKGDTLLNRDRLKVVCDALKLNYFFCLQRVSRLFWEIYYGESFPSLSDEYDFEE